MLKEKKKKENGYYLRHISFLEFITSTSSMLSTSSLAGLNAMARAMRAAPVELWEGVSGASRRSTAVRRLAEGAEDLPAFGAVLLRLLLLLLLRCDICSD